ncbi:sodium pump decarboxylase subunit gamma [Arcobacter suis]|uniref:Oxaloacetate decarboxylase, gamma subunit n=2 Tax=Arcobacter suis TaxID=1278212 RepID=A0AAD0WPS7_9BACT|nr:OadG family protein [Arcobacter suis]AXX88738.1 oxaloacetate decarboxylase, gamma subunit [Arcobacter suis CECT 7833]RWS45467.1 sodium pump decarboxylase subunit gamma [Arcobacter suis]
METNLVAQVVELLLVGMGIVFTFLILAVFMTKGKILKKFLPQEEMQTQTINVVLEANVTNTEAAKIAAVIAAVQHHKNLKG